MTRSISKGTLVKALAAFALVLSFGFIGLSILEVRLAYIAKVHGPQ